MVGGGDINNVESSGPSRLAVTAEASSRLPSGDVEASAVFESGSFTRSTVNEPGRLGDQSRWMGWIRSKITNDVIERLWSN